MVQDLGWRICTHSSLLNLVRRAAYKVTEREKKHDLGRARDNFEYMLKHTSLDFILRPDIHSQLGNILLLSGDSIGASREFQKANQLRMRQQLKKEKLDHNDKSPAGQI